MVIYMVKPRTTMKYGTTGKKETKNFDLFMRNLRDKGALVPTRLVEAGISKGIVLQIGHGPGYTGLEWLKHTQDTHLKALDVSLEMIEIAKNNLKEYPGLENRIEYVNSSADKMKFENDSIDGIFCNGEIHEWPDPIAVFNEINRVLKPGGKYLISAHNRAVSSISLLLEKIFVMRGIPNAMWQEYKSVIAASYTYDELKEILEKTNLKKWELIKGKMVFRIVGEK